MDFDYTNMGARIKLRRTELKIKQAKLAEWVDISNNHMSSIETGHQKLSMDTFIQICNALKVTPDYLLLSSMHGKNLPEDITAKLQLCSQKYIELADGIIELLVQRNQNEHLQ